MNDSIEDIRRELGTDRKRRKHAPPEAEFICEGCYKPIIGRVNRTADDVSLCDACADECIAAGSVEAPEHPAPEADCVCGRPKKQHGFYVAEDGSKKTSCGCKRYTPKEASAPDWRGMCEQLATALARARFAWGVGTSQTPGSVLWEIDTALASFEKMTGKKP